MNNDQEKLLLEALSVILDNLKIIGYAGLQNTEKIGTVINTMEKVNDRLVEIQKEENKKI